MTVGLVFLFALLLSGDLSTQESQQDRTVQEGSFGSKFFDQLRMIFGRFQNSDLDRVFQQSKPIQCSELVGRKGEWRPVAFFNEDRRLGDWCRESLEEVKNDLTVFTLRGPCTGEQGPVQLSTEFPTAASIEAYNAGRIELNQIDVTVNDPVTAAFDARTTAYKFELPYLFLTGRQGSTNIYSLVAPNRDSAYATDVTNLWECKAVFSNDVTYRFLICRTTTAPRGTAARNQKWERAFGASAYFILSDGTEAQTSVNLTFGDGSDRSESAAEKEVPAASPARPHLTREGMAKLTGGWREPDFGSKLLDAGKDRFRLRFSTQTWRGRAGTSQLLCDEKMSEAPSTRPPEGMDCCIWIPEDPKQAEALLSDSPDEAVLFSLSTLEKGGQSSPSILMSLRGHDGKPLGRLQCYFPHSKSAAAVTIEQWISVVGGHLTLETWRR